MDPLKTIVLMSLYLPVNTALLFRKVFIFYNEKGNHAASERSRIQVSGQGESHLAGRNYRNQHQWKKFSQRPVVACYYLSDSDFFTITICKISFCQAHFLQFPLEYFPLKKIGDVYQIISYLPNIHHNL
jgi:hypothetical protein